MSDVFEEGAPFYFATRQPPSATAMDEDSYLTVIAGVPTHPDQVELIDIILSVDFAKHAIAQLSAAVETATEEPGSLEHVPHCGWSILSRFRPRSRSSPEGRDNCPKRSIPARAVRRSRRQD